MNDLDKARSLAEHLGLTLCVVGPDQIEVTTGDEEPRIMTVEQFFRVYGGK